MKNFHTIQDPCGALYVSLHRIIPVLIIGFFVSAVSQSVDTITLDLNSQGSIQSDNFPSSCCIVQRTTLRIHSNVPDPAYIHLSFTDLDLPPGSDFKIYSSTSEISRNLYRSQPRYQDSVWRQSKPRYRGAWKRPFLTSDPMSRTIHLVLKPSSQIRYSTYNPESYAGFRATYTVIKDTKDSYYNLIDDRCSELFPPMDPNIVEVQTLTIPSYKDKWLDCVWVLKPATYRELPRDWAGTFVQIFVHIQELQLYGQAFLQINNSTYSTGSNNERVRSLAELTNPVYISKNGFYIRAVMPADDYRVRLKFTYGDVRLTGSGCILPSVYCSIPYNDWCVAPPDHCLCPNKDAVSQKNCVNNYKPPATYTPPPQRTTTTTTRRATTRQIWTTPIISSSHDTIIIRCGQHMQYCPHNGSCISVFDRCPYDCKQDEVTCFGGTCIDPTTEYCPETLCPAGIPFRCDKIRCLDLDARCNHVFDCNDHSDEAGCEKLSKTTKNLLVVLIAIPIALLTVLGIWCTVCKKKNSNQAASPRVHEMAPLAPPSPLPSPQIPIRRDVNLSPAHRETDRRSSPYLPSGDLDQTVLSPQTLENYSPSTIPRNLGRNSPPQNSPQNLRDDSPPPYSEITQNNEPPPPPYEMAIQGPQVHIL